MGNETVNCWLSVGNSAPLNTQCGDTTTGRLAIGQDSSLSTVGSSTPIVNIVKESLISATSVNYVVRTYGKRFLVPSIAATLIHEDGQEIYYGSSSTAFGNAVGRNMQHTFYGPVNVGGTLSGLQSVQTFGANYTGTVVKIRGYVNGVTVNAGANGTLTTYTLVEANALPTSGVTTTNAKMFACTGVGGGTTVNSCYTTTERTGGTNNAAYHIDSNSATCGAGLVAGTAFDTCLYRGRAGAWTGPAGTDIYTDSGYICAGTGCSSVTSTNTGVYDAGVRVMSSVSCTGATCSLTNGALSITVSGGGGGVTSLAGTSGEVEVSAATGSVVVGLPSVWTPSFSSVLLQSSGGGTGIRMDGLASFSVYETVSGDDVFGYDLATAQLTASKHMHFITPNPTYTFGAAAGTGPTGSGTALGGDQVFTVQFTTGTSPATNDVVFALTWAFTWSIAPQVVFSAGNAASAAAMTSVFVDSVSTGSMTFSVGAVALQASTIYKWNFHAFGAF